MAPALYCGLQRQTKKTKAIGYASATNGFCFQLKKMQNDRWQTSLRWAQERETEYFRVTRFQVSY